MKTIKISKEKLLYELERNRSEHKAIYEEAVEGWEQQVIQGLTEALTKAIDGEEYITDLDLDEPPCHLDQYDNIIARVKWHEDDTIELDHREFNQFILDQWDWQYSFLTNAVMYSSSSSSSSSSSMAAEKMRTLNIG